MDFILNGRPVSIEAEPGTSLLELLRERFGLRSMKDGCAPEGSCGACTVLVDGRPVVSCARDAAEIAGRDVVTLEGLPADARSAWAAAFTSSGASQCGFCSPGIVMKSEGLLTRDPAPSREAIARSLAGNLCRCTGYVKVIDAIEAVAAARRGERDLPAATAGGGVGARADRIGAREMALGEQPFVADMSAPGMLHAALRLSDHPRAVVLRIDTAHAAAAPGVVAVVTAADVLCRCTGYVKIIDAIEAVAAGRRGEAAGPTAAVGGGVGARADRIGAREMALGEQPFVADMTAPGMLHAALRLSDHPRAIVRRIDTSRAALAPGVVAVVTAADVPASASRA